MSTHAFKFTKAMTRSVHEQNFHLYWRMMKGPKLEMEFRFHPSRMWRFDACHRETMIAFELQGGVWRRGGGAHSGLGFERDCEKFLEASLLGWRVIQLHQKQITTPTVERLIAFVRSCM